VHHQPRQAPNVVSPNDTGPMKVGAF
jgi:hypothetical protein